jgi:hypothetical protein
MINNPLERRFIRRPGFAPERAAVWLEGMSG